MDRLLELIEARNWADAWAEYQRLADPQHPRLLLMGSHAAFGLRDLNAARSLAAQALLNYSPAWPGRLLGQIRFHLGMVEREIGDTTAAFQEFNLFLSELPIRYPELASATGPAHFYLGLILRQWDRLEESISEYRMAADLLRSSAPAKAAQVLQNLAWVLCLQGRTVEAREALAEARLLMDPADQPHQVLGDAFIALTDGDLAGAATLCEEIRRMPEAPDEVQSHAGMISARIALAQGDIPEASSLADAAFAAAARAADVRLMTDAWSIATQIRLHQQRAV